MEAALPPYGTARPALFLPGQLELDPKQRQIIAALTRTPWVLSQPQGLRTSRVSPAERRQKWAGSRDGMHRRSAGAGIASAFVTLLSSDPSLLVLWFLTRKVP